MARHPCSVRFLPLLLWLATFLFSHASLQAVTLTASPKVEVTKDSATITWRTDVECGSRLNYGKSPAALNQRADGKVSADHTVTIGALEPGTTYYYSVGSAREKLAAGSFTTSTTNATTPQAATSSGEDKSKSGGLSGLLSKIGIGKSPSPAPAPTRPVEPRAPPKRATWGNLSSLVDHFERHGRDFGATSPDDYAAKAWLFREQARAASLPMKLDADGTVRMWDGRTRTFAAYNHDGTTKTFFKPDSPTYWQRQPGRPITPAQLPFK